MAKEFKDYDKKYSSFKGKLLPLEGKSEELDHWPYMGELIKCSATEIARVVYHSGDASEEWQKFRVSLKGFSSAQKLGRLNRRWIGYVMLMHDDDERIRIDNYVDSMKRSGSIDQAGKVIK